MKTYQVSKLTLPLYLFLSLALIMIADFAVSKKELIEPITRISREHQQYFNAGGNSHHTFKVYTQKHSFHVSDNFVKKIEPKQEIRYTISLLFNEVNTYGLKDSKNNHVYTLRLLTGFVVPLLTICTMVLAFKYHKKMSIFIFIIQVLSIANFILLLL